MTDRTSSSILPRNEIHGYVACPSILSIHGRRDIVRRDLTKAKDLIQFLFDLHYRKGFMPKRQFMSYFSEARKFIREVDPCKIEYLMLKAAEAAKYSWGFRFVKAMEKQ